MNNILPRPRLLILAALGLLAAGVIWMTLSRVDQVVRADGRVIPAGKTQVVQHLEGGIVSAVAVREGNAVRQGDLLVSISDARANSVLGERKVKVSGLQAKVARLRAEAEGASGFSTASDDAMASAEHALFQARRHKLSQELDVLEEQIRQKNAEIYETENRRRSLGAELDVARHQLTVITGLLAKNAASKLELLEAQGKVQRLLTETSEAEAAIPRIRAAIKEAEARRGEIVARYRAEARSELSAAQLEIDRTQEEVRAEKDRVARTDIRSPVNGVVNRVYVNTIGGVVKPGEPIMELTPNDTRIVIEASVRPNDRASLRPGLPANVKVGAYDFGIYGTLRGRLSEVSADTLVDERGNRYYRVQLEVDAVPPAYSDKPITPGMPVSADIVTGRRTVLQYVLSPLNRFAYGAFREPR